ncbi:cytochrome c1 heme lyase [Cyclospora cayetanensis]|uniref:Holocytochrome c-type synthase n=1 Tax=Cyclospora cayetanensis TaxID=88456 RepID=A0A1D3CWZ1_9EIME|nr:cytochrome c1 heme lyase [Cyclospora cayetanensis]
MPAAAEPRRFFLSGDCLFSLRRATAGRSKGLGADEAAPYRPHTTEQTETDEFFSHKRLSYPILRTMPECPLTSEMRLSGCPLARGTDSESGEAEREWGAAASSNIQVPPGLSTERASSSIPSKEGHWKYPSEKQFYTATLRKGHAVGAGSMPAVVAIHNAVNEETWRQIKEWEALHGDTCAASKLIRFVGRPSELSLKARLRHWGGFERPFDRHDWLVDRCGKNIRYIIDYYDGKGEGDKVSICVDVRPDLSSFCNAWDRVRMFFLRSRVGSWLMKGQQ